MITNEEFNTSPIIVSDFLKRGHYGYNEVGVGTPTEKRETKVTQLLNESISKTIKSL